MKGDVVVHLAGVGDHLHPFGGRVEIDPYLETVLGSSIRTIFTMDSARKGQS